MDRKQLLRANKQRRRKLFRKALTSGTLGRYSFYNVNNCLIGQLIRFATGAEDATEGNGKALDQRIEKTIKFFGLIGFDTTLMRDFYAGQGWIRGLNNTAFQDAIETLDQKIFV